MLEPSNNFDESNYSICRSDSFSTINSSIAAADLNRQYADLSKPKIRQPIVEAVNPPHMKFEKSENINVIYNTYYNNPVPEQNPSRNNSIASFLSKRGRQDLKFNFLKFLRTKKGAWILFLLFVVILTALSTVICYFVFLDKRPLIYDQTTTLTTQETTEPAATMATTTDPAGADSTTSNSTTPNEISSTISVTKDPATTTITPELTEPQTEEPNPSNSTTTPDLNPNNTTTEDPELEITTTEFIVPNTTTTTSTDEPTTANEDPTTTTTTSKIPTTTTTPRLYPEYYMTRDDWGADPPRSEHILKLQQPIKKIIIGHTGGRICNNVTDCIKLVKSIQAEDICLEDIAYNFLIGVDGKVYEGRGFAYQGEHTKNIGATNYNGIGIMIAFIGNYKSTSPSVEQLFLLERFIKFFQDFGKISKDHLIFSQDDLMYQNNSADALNGAVANLQNYYSLYKIYRREEWGAVIPNDLPKFSRVMSWNILRHYVGTFLVWTCSDLPDCIKEVKRVETENLKSNNTDIIYNFIVGVKGLVFEGRGWDIIGQTAFLPSTSISVLILGDYRYTAPAPEVENSLKRLFEDGLVLGKLASDYKVFGISDFGGAGPGALLMNQIKRWDRYGNKTLY